MTALPQTTATGSGESQTTPAPPTKPIPRMGDINPTKHDGSTPTDNQLSRTPLEADPKGVQQTDASFMKETAVSNLTEIAASRIAVQRAADPKVKEFAQHMVSDHEAMTPRLSALAASRKVKLPDKLDAKRQTSVDKLEKSDAKDFDSQYVEQMVSDHDELIGFLERRSKESKDADVKSFIAQALPELRQHDAMAKSLHGVAANR